MADDSELDYIKTFIGKVNTAHTVATIETTMNINNIADTQSVLVYAGETLSTNDYSVLRQYSIQYKDATEGALNASIYAIREGIRKLNNKETITDYTKPSSLIGMDFLSGGRDFHHFTSGSWYTNIIITVRWLIV